MKKLISLAGLALVVIVGSHISGSISPSANEVLNNREVRTNVSKMLDDIIAEESKEQSQGELMYIVSDSYLREEPAEDAKLIADLNVGAEVLVVGEVGEFKEVEFFNTLGYVYSENIGDAEQLKEKEEAIKGYQDAMAQYDANVIYENRSEEEKQKEYEELQLQAQQDQKEKEKAEAEHRNSLTPLDLMMENIELEGTDDESLKSDVEEYFSLLPEKMLEEFNNSGWRITLTTKDIASSYYDGEYIGRICGLTMPDTKHIVYEANSSKFRRNTLHEFFHFVDINNDNLSYKEEWQRIYNKEKDRLKVTDGSNSSHYKKNAQEFWAEAFQEYIIKPSGVEASSPQAYKYISEFLENYL